MPLIATLLSSVRGNPVTFIVRAARVQYTVIAGFIALAWYTAWRNERTAPGERKPVIPGLARGKARYGPSREDAPLPSTIGDIGPVGQDGAARGQTVGGSAGTIGGIPLHGAGHPNLIQIGHAAQKMGLRVSEHPAFGGVHPVHHAGSLHYKGRAIDVSGSESNMRAFAGAVQEAYGSHIAELIHNPGFSIKNGKRVPPSFWGAQTWAAHTNHVHLGI